MQWLIFKERPLEALSKRLHQIAERCVGTRDNHERYLHAGSQGNTAQACLNSSRKPNTYGVVPLERKLIAEPVGRHRCNLAVHRYGIALAEGNALSKIGDIITDFETGANGDALDLSGIPTAVGYVG